MSGMQGRVVVLTGGTSGIGEAAAVKLAKMGARLVLVARDASRAEATLKRLQKVSPGPPGTLRTLRISRWLLRLGGWGTKSLRLSRASTC
jgi:NAD(P)-dependent dehydrogenase (short-subunit alcohol dehydrogenase family)